MSDKIALEQKLKLILKTRADLLMKLSGARCFCYPFSMQIILCKSKTKLVNPN